eukprot:gb/GFBE01061198.1/.p1 GENE.gb/GFBE01061198.1/~~gb/GFBE01061198.1/.p1  ORF type:complete len:315 (+),score=39.92 gb/GFBE01061198.1/:1-945(+)
MAPTAAESVLGNAGLRFCKVPKPALSLIKSQDAAAIEEFPRKPDAEVTFQEIMQQISRVNTGRKEEKIKVNVEDGGSLQTETSTETFIEPPLSPRAGQRRSSQDNVMPAFPQREPREHRGSSARGGKKLAAAADDVPVKKMAAAAAEAPPGQTDAAEGRSLSPQSSVGSLRSRHSVHDSNWLTWCWASRPFTPDRDMWYLQPKQLNLWEGERVMTPSRTWPTGPSGAARDEFHDRQREGLPHWRPGGLAVTGDAFGPAPPLKRRLRSARGGTPRTSIASRAQAPLSARKRPNSAAGLKLAAGHSPRPRTPRSAM